MRAGLDVYLLDRYRPHCEAFFSLFFLRRGKVVALLDADGGAGWEFLELLLSAPAAASSATRLDSGSLNLITLYSRSSLSAAERRGCVHKKKRHRRVGMQVLFF